MRIAIAIFFLLSLGQLAHAVPIFYFGEDLNPSDVLPPSGNATDARNNFLGAIVGAGTENMEGFTNGTSAPLTLQFTGSTGPITANLTGTGTGSFDAVWNSPFDGRFAISGDQFWQTASIFDLNFSEPISAFGFFATDGGDGPGQLTLRLGITGGGTTDFVVPHSVGDPLANGAVFFYGFADAAVSYSSISFLNSDPGHDFFGFDDWTVGSPTAIPEPTTLALMALGVAGLGFRRKLN